MDSSENNTILKCNPKVSSLEQMMKKKIMQIRNKVGTQRTVL